jgi:hypothetical protein
LENDESLNFTHRSAHGSKEDGDAKHGYFENLAE